MYICSADIGMTQQLKNLIEKWQRTKGGLCFGSSQGWPCHGLVRSADGTEETCRHRLYGSDLIYPRNITLQTLNQDMFSSVLKDWRC